MPTIFAKMEETPNASFCESIQSAGIAEVNCTKGNVQQYIDSIYFALIQLPGKYYYVNKET